LANIIRSLTLQGLLLLLPWLLQAPAANAGVLERLFAPSAQVWSFWDTHGTATDVIDNSPWQRFLQNYVRPDDDGINRVEYAKVTAAERAALRNYIERLQKINIRDYGRDEQLAYWINLYNAVTVNVVLEHYPVASIRDIDISPGFLSFGPWDKKLLSIEGQAVSLNDIEHRILRPIWKDPRLHYALNCASLGCPNLQTTAFTAVNTPALLDASARDYVNHPRGVSIIDGELRVSSIYSWFREDFGDNDADVIKHLRRYASAGLAAELAGFDHIDDDDYDWSLNDTEPVEANPVTAEDFN
jgi:hypothetical protein